MALATGFLSRVILLASLAAMANSPSLALEKQMSLVTKQPIGELSVAGRLSIDLHAEFMVSRTYDKNTVLNWYNCGYSGGNRISQNGGDFGDFGFQVPFKERDQKYPKAVRIGAVPAVSFDGNDFLKAKFEVEKSMAGTQPLAIEIWFRAIDPGTVLLGWQSPDAKETSCPIGMPAGFKGSDSAQHLVINCTPTSEDWYLNGKNISSSARKSIMKAGHIMVLGGVSSEKPSFKGDLIAVRLHDKTMTEEQIAHNFAGGAMLGTKLHSWWRTEPDKWWAQESEHFRHCVDKEEMKKWTPQQLKEFEQRVPGMFSLAELNYHTYSERLAMRSSVVSVLPEERGDGIKYKTPIQPSDGSWMGWDGHFGWACQGAGFINPHELAHGWYAMTGNMFGPYWEAMANFPQTYNGVYQTIPVIAAECSAFPASGRTYYHDRTMFEHLAQTPEYGPMFIAKMWYDGPTEQDKSPYPWMTFNRINPYPDKTLSDEFAKMAMRNVVYDYITYAEASAGKGNTPNGNDAVISPENRYQKHAQGMKSDIDRYARIVLQKIPYEPNWWRVPKEQAPQQFGWNICPLMVKPGTKVAAKLQGYVNPERGSDWRAGFVGVDSNGKPVYGKVFGPGTLQTFDVNKEIKELYLVVCATPTKVMLTDIAGDNPYADFRSFEQQQFPYKVSFEGCEPVGAALADKPKVEGAAHSNGGGFVEFSAQVDRTAYVGPNAQVLGRSKVIGKARIEDYSVVENATVKDSALVSGHALVKEESVVADNAKVRGYAVVKGRTTVKGNARILEHAAIFTQKACSDNVTVKGVSSVYGGNQSGTAMIDGFYAKGNDITKGKWFTWSWGQGKNAGEIDEDFGGLYANYEFNDFDPAITRDSFGATWGYLVGSPKIAVLGRTAGAPGKPASISGALTLDGKAHFVELPADVVDFSSCTYTFVFKWNGLASGEKLFEACGANNNAMWISPSEGGKLVFAIRKGDQVERMSAPAVKAGVWTTLRVTIGKGTAKMSVNGKVVAQSKEMKLSPDSVRASQVYIGKGPKGGYFKGLIDRFTVHCVPLD